MLGARIEAELKRLVDADPRDNQDIVAAALWDEFGGQRQSAIEKRIEHKDRRIMQVKKEIRDLEEELETVQSEKAALQHQLDKMETATTAYDDDLDDILDAAESGERETRIIPAALSDLAERHGESPEDIHETLKQRAIEQERAIQARMFVPAMHEENVPRGTVNNVWGDDDE